ncbi:MAG: recombinase family protein [Thermotaleaceae bacterium]
MLKRVIGYTRVSTQMQADEGLSLDAQKSNLEDFCERYEYQFLGIYQDAGLSGRNINRPQLQQMLNDAAKGLFDIVLVWKISRISRNLKDLLTIVEELEKRKVALISCTEPFDTSTHLGKAFLQILGTFAELERNTLAENVKMSLMDNAKKGRWNGGVVYGYDAVEGELCINQREAEVVKKIFDLYIQGWGYSKIMNYLNKSEVETKKGAKWNIQQIKRTLSNPVYIGQKSYNKIIDSVSNPRSNPNKDTIIISVDSHIPIISLDRFNLVQKMIRSKYTRRKDLKSIHLLSGIIQCPFCKQGMVTKRASSRIVNGQRQYITYYQCQTYHNKGGCRSFLVNEEKIESDVLDKLIKIFSDEEILQFTIEAINEKNRDKNKPLREELIQLEKEVQHKMDEIKNLIEFISKTPTLNHKQIQSEIEQRQNEINVIRNKRNKKIQRLQGGLIEDIDKEMLMSYIWRIKDILTENVEREQLRQLISAIVSDVIVNQDKKIGEIKIWFNNISCIDRSTVKLPLTNTWESKGDCNESNQ